MKSKVRFVGSELGDGKKTGLGMKMYGLIKEGECRRIRTNKEKIMDILQVGRYYKIYEISLTRVVWPW
jgi:hypothetical protein